MDGRALPVAGGNRGAADRDLAEIDAAFHSPESSSRQDPQPIERHEPLADDKLALFEVRVPSWMLRRLVEHFRRPPLREARP
jgi:hypothetical protein